MPTSIRIVCGDENEAVGVSEEDTQMLLDESDYFRAIFKHGTRETQLSITHKPKRTKIVIEHIIRLICSSTTAIMTFQHLRYVLIASNKILLGETHVFGNEGNNIFNVLP